MKTYLILLLSITQTFYSFAQKNSGDQPYLTKSLSANSFSKLEVTTSGGNISVMGGSSADARVEVYVKDNAGKDLSKDEISNRLNDYDFSVDVNNNTLTAVAKNKNKKWDWKNGLSVSFKIYSPNAVSSNLLTSGGNISLHNLEGNQKFRTSGGNLSIENIAGDIDGATSGGNIVISKSHENMMLKTSGGNVEATDCNGTLDISTSGGNVQLDNLNGNIKAHTSGGNIKGNTISGSLLAKTSGGNIKFSDLSCSLETATSGGSMNIEMVKLGEYVRLQNSGGSIDLQLPKNEGMDLHVAGSKIKTGTVNNFNGNTEDGKMDGKLNGGGIPVLVKTSGRVTLNMQ